MLALTIIGAVGTAWAYDWDWRCVVAQCRIMHR